MYFEVFDQLFRRWQLCRFWQVLTRSWQFFLLSRSCDILNKWLLFFVKCVERKKKPQKKKRRRKKENFLMTIKPLWRIYFLKTESQELGSWIARESIVLETQCFKCLFWRFLRRLILCYVNSYLHQYTPEKKTQL